MGGATILEALAIAACDLIGKMLSCFVPKFLSLDETSLKFATDDNGAPRTDIFFHLASLYGRENLSTVDKRVAYFEKLSGSTVNYHAVHAVEVGSDMPSLSNVLAQSVRVTDGMKLGVLLYEYLENVGLIQVIGC